MSVTAIYPGTFDPITNGHIDIVRRASDIFGQVYIGIADTCSTEKKTCFTTQERIHLAEIATADIPNVSVKSFNTLATSFARDVNASVIIRGLRMVSDFDYEFQMAGMNNRLMPEAETVFLTTAENLSYISSSLIRQIVSLGGDVSEFVHPEVERALTERLGNPSSS